MDCIYALTPVWMLATGDVGLDSKVIPTKPKKLSLCLRLLAA